jgi:hypothetical protein
MRKIICSDEAPRGHNKLLRLPNISRRDVPGKERLNPSRPAAWYFSPDSQNFQVTKIVYVDGLIRPTHTQLFSPKDISAPHTVCCVHL